MSYANRPLNRQDYKTLTLAALGGALEFYDFIIFVFFAAVVGELFFPADIPEWLRQVQTFGIFAAGYLARPLGESSWPTLAIWWGARKCSPSASC
ncbi:L-Proline/Glycine betaine transporter ProP [Klebsiella pneumoniae]|nr:L-Proline/Glycine betaine transporter ProP [Klebsiella pneumoniae]